MVIEKSGRTAAIALYSSSQDVKAPVAAYLAITLSNVGWVE
jgi:hypothetical protein